MGPKETQSHVAARKRLLEEGTRSYLEAVTALIEFQREVQKRCRSAMEASLDDYGSALKVDLRSSEIRESDWPKFSEWEGNFWILRASILRRDIPKIKWWETSCNLQYDVGENGLYCWVGEQFPTKRMALELFNRFTRLSPDVICEDDEVSIQQSLTVEESATLEDKLRNLYLQWIELWKKAGGMNAVFKGDDSSVPESDES
jgi:hypothetical protein